MAYMQSVAGQLEDAFKSLEAYVDVMVRYPGTVRYRCVCWCLGTSVKNVAGVASIEFPSAAPKHTYFGPLLKIDFLAGQIIRLVVSIARYSP